MSLKAQDAAIEDALYYLDKALQKGVLSGFDAYLKVRTPAWFCAVLCCLLT
jgi:hypothetical protein